MQKPIILLDLMYTLIGNMAERDAWFAAHGHTPDAYLTWIEQAEHMRGWLVDLLRASGGRVILITARSLRYQEASLLRIAADTGGWRPDEAYFSTRPQPPPAWKHLVLHKHVFPAHGDPDATRYLALESNPATRRMYAAHDIPAIPVPVEPWTALPVI